MIRCVAFDFDGTLVQSNDIKRQAYFEISADTEGAVDAMSEVLATCDGDRYRMFEALSVRLFADNPTRARCKARHWAQRYGDYCHERIVVCSEVGGTTAALRRLKVMAIRCYVNSATPVGPLHRLVEERDMRDWFAGVFGAPSSKADNLHQIMKQEGIEPSGLVVVGDGPDDLAAARETGCHFLGVGPEGSTRLPGDVDLMRDLTDLPDRVARLAA